MIERFCEDWVAKLNRDDLVSLALFLCFQLTSHLNVGETKAAELVSIMIKYQRSGIVWSHEDLNKRATRYVHENVDVKGRPNLTVRLFMSG